MLQSLKFHELKLKKGVLVCHRDPKMKETKTAKVKAKPKEGGLLYLQIPGTEVFHQVPMMMEKETAEEETKAGVALQKEKTKTETKGKEDNCPHGGSLGKWIQILDSGTGTKIHIGMQIQTGTGMRTLTGKRIKNRKHTVITLGIGVGIEIQYLELILSYHVEKGQLVALVNFHVLELKDLLKPFI